MHAAIHGAWPAAAGRWRRARELNLELRIDVGEPPSERLSDELDGLYRRLRTRGDRLHGLAWRRIDGSPFVVHYREADGEFFFYVEDAVQRRLAGYVVFNRLVEVGRRADRCLRSPHAKFDDAYQRRGLASTVYGWMLESGLCLLSGARQSPGAHALWRSLARRHEHGYLRLEDKVPHYLGREVAPQVFDQLNTRMLLLGRGWTLDSLREAAGIR
ncbi:MAG: N-acetyltransferase [Burkholderiaceae bacterium]